MSAAEAQAGAESYAAFSLLIWAPIPNMAVVKTIAIAPKKPMKAASPRSPCQKPGSGGPVTDSRSVIRAIIGSRPMKAIVYDHYGPPDVLHIEEVARPEP